jgi:hypothetical protein
MDTTHMGPKEGRDFEVNWALRFLSEQGATIGQAYEIGCPTGQSSHGLPPIERVVRFGSNSETADGIWMTDEEVIRKAESCPAWRERKRLFLNHLQNYQDEGVL